VERIVSIPRRLRTFTNRKYINIKVTTPTWDRIPWDGGPQHDKNGKETNPPRAVKHHIPTLLLLIQDPFLIQESASDPYFLNDLFSGSAQLSRWFKPWKKV